MTSSRLVSLAFLLTFVGATRPAHADEPVSGVPEADASVVTSTDAAPQDPPAPIPNEALASEPAEPPNETDAPVLPSADVSGHVVGSRGNDVIVDLGESSGMRLGARVALERITPVDLGDGEIAYEHETIAIGEVTALTGRRALVRLGSNEFVPVGALAVLRPATDETTDSRIDPPRVGGVWEVSGSARIFAVNSALGGGMLGDLAFGYRGERPFFVHARLAPSGFTAHRPARDASFRAASAGSGMVLAGIDHRYFGFGAGFGVTRVLPVTRIYCDYSSTASCVEEPDAATSGFSFGLHGRIGNQDGLMLAVDASFTTVRESSEPSLLDARLQVPVTPTLALHLRGGSGFRVTGSGFVDIGARLRARGDGGPGTIYVTPFLGWARLAEGLTQSFSRYSIYDTWNEYDERVDGERGGPSAGVTVESRF